MFYLRLKRNKIIEWLIQNVERRLRRQWRHWSEGRNPPVSPQLLWGQENRREGNSTLFAAGTRGPHNGIGYFAFSIYYFKPTL